jgi:hypothetical protein
MFWSTVIRQCVLLNFISKSEEGEEECGDVRTELLNIAPVPQMVNSEQNIM